MWCFLKASRHKATRTLKVAGKSCYGDGGLLDPLDIWTHGPLIFPGSWTPHPIAVHGPFTEATRATVTEHRGVAAVWMAGRESQD